MLHWIIFDGFPYKIVLISKVKACHLDELQTGVIRDHGPGHGETGSKPRQQASFESVHSSIVST